MRRLIAALTGVFILSGAAGLIYESIWSRYLGLFVGHSAYAQIIVLVIFLGGMSLGAAIVGRRSATLRSPLLWYAGVELLVGVLAMIFHQTFVAATGWAYDTLFPALPGAMLHVVKWGLAGLLILPQSMLLGATFPLMSAGVIRLAREEQRPGRLLGLLYFANSIGAAAGVLVAGFVLIGAVGLPGTLVAAACINVVAACAVWLIARTAARSPSDEEEPEALIRNPGKPGHEMPAPGTGSVVLRRRLLMLSFGTAVASFIYEIAWIRMLSLVLGSATHSFELMLSAFILGLALGALWIRSRADALANPVRFLGIVQWIMGVLAVATLPLYIASFDWMATVLATVQANESGYRAFAVMRYVFCLLVMLPATFCAGTTLPLITRVLMRSGSGERAIGAVYAVNTLGSIAGVILAGLLLMPLLGLKMLLILGALLDIGLGVWLVAAGRRAAPEPRRLWHRAPPLGIPLAATVAVLALAAFAAPFDLLRLTSGVYRHGVVERSGNYTFPFYRDGRTATVSMRRNEDGFITLATNGKPDASMERAWMDSTDTSERQLTRDIATQLLLPMITLAHSPRARYAAVIGQGSGMTSHVLLGSPHLKQVVTVEIEPEMIHASRLFLPANRRVFEDPRSFFVVDDAKSYFASTPRQFDIIVSEPSNPWVSGVSGLFTREFYARVRRQLSDSGVFGQWLHLYELNDRLVTSVLSAIDAEFADYEVFYTSNADILVVAANHPLPAPDWGVSGFPGIARDMRHVVPFGRESFEALRLAGREVLHPMLASSGTVNSDFYPTLDLNAERMRFMHESAEGYTGLSGKRFDVAAALTGRRAAPGNFALSLTPEIARSSALALSARVRAVRALSAAEAAKVPMDPDLRAALYRLDALDRVVSSPLPPRDWHEWMDAVVAVDADLHAGSPGVVDPAFFARVRAFTARTGAPADARSAVDFLHGIGAWNWPEAAAAAKALAASRDTMPWIPDVLLRDAGTVALIRAGDLEGAKALLRAFARRTSDDRFRERLIANYLIFQDPELRRKMDSR